jgi:biotin carboxylase
MERQKNILIFLMNLRPSMIADVRRYEAIHGKQYRIMYLRDSRLRRPEPMPEYDLLVECDFSKPHKIAAALLPYQDELLAITCRSEANIARFAKVIPHVPYLRTPTSESLLWATDKYEMRKRFQLHAPKSTPVFTLIKHNTKKERTRVVAKVGFPMVVKPANLAASRFVSICYHEEELEKTLRTTFRKLRAAYAQDNRLEEPKVMAEEYLEGDLYSIDSYVDGRGTVYHCPMVRVVTGRQIGHDDFYNYKQTTPTALKRETVAKAEAVAEQGIQALGLRSTGAHVELMQIDDEWKIIEIGPRLGGFRDTLHQLSCDINHTMNDIAVRIPRKPVIPKKCKGYATAMKWFAEREGTITEMRGIKKIEALESFHNILVNKKIGDRAVFARNGGRSVFNLFLYNSDRSKLLADIRRVEKMVEVKVGVRNGASKTAKKTKKVAKKKVTKGTTKKNS